MDLMTFMMIVGAGIQLFQMFGDSGSGSSDPIPGSGNTTSSGTKTNGGGGSSGTGGLGGAGDIFAKLGSFLQGAGGVIGEKEKNAPSRAVTPGSSPTFQGRTEPARNANLEAIIQAMSGGVFAPGRK